MYMIELKAATIENNLVTKTGIDTVLIKVASRCNINCGYCYVYHLGDDNWSKMEKLISFDTMDAVCDSLIKLAEYQKMGFSIVLHGGEPFLLGAVKLNHFLDVLRKAFPNTNKFPISIQSNGILITNKILDVCSKHKTSISISIDGPKHIHDKMRVGHKGYGTFDEVLEGIMALKSHRDSSFLYAGLLAVIDPSSKPSEVYSFFKELAPPSVDFLYKDGNHSRLPLGKSFIDSTEYGTWMIGLLDSYLNDSNPTPIRILDDMMKVLLGSIVVKEGMGLTDFGILVIDTDGTITKNDTLKSSYNGADQFEKPLNIKDGLLIELLNSEEFKNYRANQRPSCQKCINCSVLNVCGAGMTLHRWEEKTGYNNPSVYCADQLLLINEIQERLAQFNL